MMQSSADSGGHTRSSSTNDESDLARRISSETDTLDHEGANGRISRHTYLGRAEILVAAHDHIQSWLQDMGHDKQIIASALLIVN